MMTESTEEEREIEFMLEEQERLVRERDAVVAERDHLKATVEKMAELVSVAEKRAAMILRAGREVKATLTGLLIHRAPGGGFAFRLPYRELGYPGLTPHSGYMKTDNREMFFLFESYEKADEALFKIVEAKIFDVERLVGSHENAD